MSGSFIKRCNEEGHQASADVAKCHVQPWRRGRPPGCGAARRVHLCEKSQCGHLHGAGGRLVFSFALCCTPSPPSSRLVDSHN